ncbi:hypothetical protein bcere0029_54360 [Bacillus cereus AH1272]|nr:hypothetical protein bcere0029_54360 [Bacillus cereus AH1272]
MVNLGGNDMKKIAIEEMTKEQQEKYTLSLEESHKLLLDHGITKSKNAQVTMRWIREAKFDALLIGKGRVETRKWLVNKESLMEFIEFSKLTIGDYKAMLEELKELRSFKIEVEKKSRKRPTTKKQTEESNEKTESKK